MEHIFTVILLLALAAGATAASLPLMGRADTEARRSRRDARLAEELAATR